MLDPDLVAALSAAPYLPVPEMRAALAEPDRIADAVLDVLDRSSRAPGLTEAEAELLFWGLHILAAAQDTRAYRPLIRLLHADGDTLDTLLGDVMTTTLTKVLISVFDGDVEPVFTMLLDSTVDSIVRNEAFAAVAYLSEVGRIPRDQVHDLLVRFDDKRAAVEVDPAWAGWEEAIALMGFPELEPRVVAARKDGRLTPTNSDPTWFPEALRETVKRRDPARFNPERFGILDDPLTDLAWAAEGFGQPVVNPLKHVGRNDPCPCGSGKKFKKCCLDKVAA
jgi:hypothetical protein